MSDSTFLAPSPRPRQPGVLTVRPAAPTRQRERRAGLSVESLGLYRERFRQSGSMTVFFSPQGLARGREEARLLAQVGVPVEVLDGPAAHAAEPALKPGVVGALYCREDALLVPARFVKGLAQVAATLGVRVATGSEVLGFRTTGDRISAVETT